MAAVVSTLTIQSAITGADAVLSALDRITAAEQRLGATTQSVARIQDEKAKSTVSQAGALDAYTRRLDPLSVAQSKVAQGEALLNSVRSQGGVITDAHTRAVTNAKAKLDELTKGANDNASAMHGHSAAVGLNRMQQMELAHVSRALFDEMAAGANPIRALMQESGRLGQILSSGSGGLGSVLKGVGSQLASVAFGWVGLSAVTLAAVGVAGYAAYSYSASQDKLSASIEGTGRRAGVTLAQLNALAGAGARSGNISLGTSQGLAAGFVGAGIDAATTAGLIGSSKRYGQITGQSTDEAGASLAKAFEDPLAGAQGLNKSLGFLNDRILSTVREYQESGNIEGARQTLARALNDSLKETTDRTWSLSRAFEDAKNNIGNGVNAIGYVLNPKSEIDQLRIDLRKQLDAPKTASGGALSGLFSGDQDVQLQNPQAIAALQGKISALESKQSNEAAAKKADIDANAVSLQVAGVIKSVLPNYGRTSDIDAKIALLTKAVSDPLALSKLGGDGSQAGQALSNLSNQRAFNDPFTKIREDAKLAVDSITAYSLAERVAVEAQRAAIQVMRESGDVLQANAAAESARNQAIARANNEAELALEKSKQSFGLIGLSPYDRRRQEIVNAGQDFKDKNVSSKSELDGAFKPFSNNLTTTATAVRSLGDAATTAAGKLQGYGGGSATGGPVAISSFGAGDKSAIADYILKRAPSFGIDGPTALKVAKSEGLNSYVGDNGSSFGPYQLHYGNVAGGGNAVGGLGDTFTKQTGLDARNPATAFQQVDFSLAQAARGGWSPWHGAANSGIGNWDGIGGRGDSGSLVSPLALTAGNDNAAKTALDLKGNDKSAILLPFQQAQQSIADMRRETDLLTSTFGKSKAELYGANEAEKLRAQYIHDGILNSKTSAENLKLLNDNIANVGNSATDAAKQLYDAQKLQQKQIERADNIRQDATDLLGAPLHAIADGKDPGKALQGALRGIGGRLIDQGVSGLVGSLFGEKGSPLGGLFGGGKGNQTVGTQNVTASIVNVAGGVGGAVGGGGGGIGGILSSIFGKGGGTGGGVIPDGALFANGGIMTALGPLPLRKYSQGGIANSPQTAIYGEGSSPEAYVPLPDGRSIPVSMRGNKGGGAIHQTINHGDIIIQGNADDSTVSKLSAVMDQKLAAYDKVAQRTLLSRNAQAQRQFGAG